MKKMLTVSELAKALEVSTEYVCRLCRLPPEHPKHIKAKKIHNKMYIIVDKKIIDKYFNNACSELRTMLLSPYGR